MAEAGTVHYLTLDQIRNAISEIGFQPRQRDVHYQLVEDELESKAITANQAWDAQKKQSPLVQLA